MNEDNSKNHQTGILEQIPTTRLMLERNEYYEIHELLESLGLKLELLESMNSLNVLMIWRDKFHANINVLNEKAIAAFHKKYSSLQATAKSPSTHSQNLNQSQESQRASGLRISEIIDLPLGSNEGCIDIGMGNASEKPSNSVDHFTPHDVAQSTTTTVPPLSNQMFNRSPMNRDMGEKDVFDENGLVDPEPAIQYAEHLMETANSGFRAPLDTQLFHSAPREMSPQSMSNSETVLSSTAARRRGDPHRRNVCSKTFTRGTTLREHARSHTNEKPYKCSTCRNGFSRRKDCRRHELLHTNHKKFRCGISDLDKKFGSVDQKHWGCGRSFTRMDALKAHWNSLRGADCLKIFFKLKKEDYFELIEYGWSFDKKCDCGNVFETLDEFKTHLDVPFQLSCLRQKVMDLVASFMMADYRYEQE